MNRYIDADKAKEQIVNSFVTDIFCLTDDEVGRADKAILDEIDKVPTADVVEVNHAKWIDSPNIMECVVCSNCMSGNLSAQVVAPAPDWYNYCPVCGAKMDEVDKQ